MGSALVPRLLDEGYRVKVLDTYWFGRDVLQPWRSDQNLIEIEGDLRDAFVRRQGFPRLEAKTVDNIQDTGR